MISGFHGLSQIVLEYLREQKEHPDHYIFVPISFISEHIEVLFDNDVECYDLCQELGVNYHRPTNAKYGFTFD